MFALQKPVQEILEEMKLAISFYERRTGKEINKILLCGGSSFLPEISSYFSSNLDLETLTPDPWEGINVEKLFKEKNIQDIIKMGLHPVFFANVIGLARRGLEKNFEKTGINFARKKKKKKFGLPNKKQLFPFLAIIAALLIFSLLGWVIYSYIFKGL